LPQNAQPAKPADRLVDLRVDIDRGEDGGQIKIEREVGLDLGFGEAGIDRFDGEESVFLDHFHRAAVQEPVIADGGAGLSLAMLGMPREGSREGPEGPAKRLPARERLLQGKLRTRHLQFH
jgi:hypothetical protein